MAISPEDKKRVDNTIYGIQRILTAIKLMEIMQPCVIDSGLFWGKEKQMFTHLVCQNSKYASHLKHNLSKLSERNLMDRVEEEHSLEWCEILDITSKITNFNTADLNYLHMQLNAIIVVHNAKGH